jgi:hypothetical protein
MSPSKTTSKYELKDLLSWQPKARPKSRSKDNEKLIDFYGGNAAAFKPALMSIDHPPVGDGLRPVIGPARKWI